MSRRGLQPTVLIAGGGTAGHLIPGLAVADALVQGGLPASNIRFVGSRRGVETDMVPQAGFELLALPGRGLNERSFTLANLLGLLALGWGVIRGICSVAARRPSVVVSLGGYAALPASVGAVLLRVPLVITEQNAVPSATNRLLGRFATACAVPFEGTALPRAVVTGNPVRRSVVEVAHGSAAGEIPWGSDRFVVVVFGGSLGSLRINTAVWDAMPRLAARGDVVVYHVVGRRDWPARPALDIDEQSYVAVPYDDDLPVALSRADLVVARAGGSTVAELAVLGVASVLVPLPIAPNDHQRHNAEALARCGAARVVDDGAFDGDRMVVEIEAAIDRGVTDAAEAARSVGRPGAAKAVADLVLSRANPRGASNMNETGE